MSVTIDHEAEILLYNFLRGILIILDVANNGGWVLVACIRNIVTTLGSGSI